MATSKTATKSSTDRRRGDRKKYQLLWRAGFSDGSSPANRIVIGSSNESLSESARNKLVKTSSVGINPANGKMYAGTYKTQSENMPVEADYIQTLLSLGNEKDITLPFNTSICLAQEYSPQITNKIASYATLAGNSIVAYGQGIRKIGLKITVIRADKFWIPYAAGLEAMTIMSGSPSRYLGNLFLHSFDTSNPGAARKYKVVVESLTPIYRSDRNTTVDFDMSMLVAYDFSTERYGRWGKLGAA